MRKRKERERRERESVRLGANFGPEMRTLPVLLTAYCISLLSRELLALRAEEREDSHRLELINHLFDTSEDVLPPSLPPPAERGPLSKWLTSLLRHHSTASGNTRSIPPSLSWAYPSAEPLLDANLIQQELPPVQLLRSRRHLSSRGTHHHHHYQQNAQLMRVGCVLGTCQVQNLSHRLYQLIGQSGREDSSPINPKSPHSYG